MNNKNGIGGLQRLINASKYSWDGLIACYQEEQAFRQEVWLGIVLIPLAFLLSQTSIELLLMLGSWILILVVELLNTGMEALADRVSLEKNDLIKKAKDTGSAAVLFSIINMIIVWSCILLF